LTNETLWRKTVSGTGFAPVAEWGMVFACTGTNSCSAFNETTGAKIWESYPTPSGIQGAPAAGTDAINGTKLVVVAETYGQYVLAYNASNTNPVNYPVWNVTPGIGWCLGSPVIYNGVVYIEAFRIYGSGEIVAINLTNGANIWKTSLPNVGGRPMWGGPLSPCINPDAGIVYVEAFGKTAGVNNYTTAIAAMNISTGSILWTTLLNNHNVSSHTSPVYTKNLGENGYVYAGDNGGYVYCLDALTGAVVWTSYYGHSYLPTGESRGISPLALDDAKNMLVFTSGNHTLWSVNALSGAVNWAKPCNSSMPGGPVIGGNNAVYVATAGTFTDAANETLRCYDATTGALIWSYTFPSLNKANLCSPILAHEHLYWLSSNYTSTDYIFICIGASIGPPPFPPFWTRSYWNSAGFDGINIAKWQGWRDIKNMSIAVNLPGPANLSVIFSMNIVSEAGGEVRLNIASTVPGYVNGTKMTVSVLGTKYGDFYYDYVSLCYSEFAAAGWYNVTFQWRSLGSLASNWMMNDPTGSPGYMHRTVHVVAQNPSYATSVFGTSDISVAKWQGWKPVAQMEVANLNLLSAHNVTVVYSIRLVSSAAVQPSGEVRLVVNGTGAGWVNGSRRVDSVYRLLGDYDCVLGNWTGLLPAGSYVVRLEWRALGSASDWMVNQPVAWADLMHREMHVIVNPP
jgi:outer membrane protein assembly factor BamB